MSNRKTSASPKDATIKRAAVRHFLDIDGIDAKSLRKIIDNAHAMKAAGKRTPAKFKPKDIDVLVLGMIFEKPSTRTRVSFDVAMRQLGGQTIVLRNDDLQLGRGESISDTAKVLSRYIDVMMIRANSHDTLLALALHADVPVINGLTDKTHPCQIMADIVTFEEKLGPIKGRTVAWVGDGNNVLVSWIHAAQKFEFNIRAACPAELPLEKEYVEWAKREKAPVTFTTDPIKAVKGADCVVTDTWVSMGQTDAARRKQILKPYQVDENMMSKAADGAIFMHCLPAYRGHEVAADVVDGPQSVVFDEAENRLHAQKAILAWCLGAD
jgi:ornithine carbamoyltransferase